MPPVPDTTVTGHIPLKPVCKNVAVFNALQTIASCVDVKVAALVKVSVPSVPDSLIELIGMIVAVPPMPSVTGQFPLRLTPSGRTRLFVTVAVGFAVPPKL